MVRTAINIFTYITVAGQLSLALALLAVISDRFFKTKFIKRLKKIVGPYAFVLAFFVALSATLGSLFLSEVAKFQPCLLCWYQRILMYPLALLLYMSIIRKEPFIRPYIYMLSSIGLVIALYHYLIQWAPQFYIVPCTATGGPSCTEANFILGYISFPLMAATAFAGIISFLLLSSNKK